MKSVNLRHLLVGICLLAMPLAPLAAAPSAAGAAPPLLLEVAERVNARVPPHARAGSAIEGRFNAAAIDAPRVTLPLGADGRAVAKRQFEFRGPRGETSWVGEFDGQPGSVLTLTAHRGAVTGFLHYNDQIWEIAPSANGRSMLFEVDQTRLPADSEPLIPELDFDVEDGTAGDAEPAPATQQELLTQDVLVVYTAKAQAKAGSQANMESKIINAVSAANAAYINSKVGFRLNLVGMVLTNYVETGDMTTSLTRVRGTSDGYMDDVHPIRDRLGADLVALITEDGGACGIAYVMGKPSTAYASSAFSVTAQSCFSNQTFAHELGHNQGNTHDRANGSGGSFPYSFGYRTCDNIAPTNGQSFRTVMAYSCSGSPRLNYFANPNVYYNGAQMGVDYAVDPANAADTSRSMNETAPYVAAFRTAASGSPPTAPDNLATRADAWDRVTLTWNDNAGDESGYVVQRSESGSSFIDRASLPPSANQFSDTGLKGSTSYTYRVRAFNGAGSSAYSNTSSVKTPAPPPPPPPPAEPAPALVYPATQDVLLTWTSSEGASAYEVLRETLNVRKGIWSGQTVTLGGDQTSLMETLAAGTYRYAVRAVNAAGASSAAVGHCDVCQSDGSFTLSTTTTTKTKGGGPKKDSKGGGSSKDR
jgi:hypothetical protein